MRGFLDACRYLTALPLPAAAAPGDLGRAAGWFPVVGLILGAVLAALAAVTDRVLPGPVGAVMLVAFWALATGGLHLDGLADAADGLGGGFSPEERLAIMRDVRTGAYGVTAVVLVLLAKVSALASLSADVRWPALVLAPVLGRLGPVLLARLCPPARADGGGHAFALSAGGAAPWAGALTALAVAVGLAGLWGLALVGLVGASAWAFAGYLRSRLGGLTGDCLGALVELVEAGVLVIVSGLAQRGWL